MIINYAKGNPEENPAASWVSWLPTKGFGVASVSNMQLVASFGCTYMRNGEAVPETLGLLSIYYITIRQACTLHTGERESLPKYRERERERERESQSSVVGRRGGAKNECFMLRCFMLLSFKNISPSASYLLLAAP